MKHDQIHRLRENICGVLDRPSHILQRRETALRNAAQDKRYSCVLVALASSVPAQRENNVRARLLDADVVPNAGALHKAVLIESCVDHHSPLHENAPVRKQLYDLLIGVEGGFDMRQLQLIENDALMTLQQYVERYGSK